MITIRRRPGKRTAQGQIFARDRLIRQLQTEVRRADKGSDVAAGWANTWRAWCLETRDHLTHTEAARQKLVGKVADLEAENRELRRRLGGEQPLKVEEQPTIVTETVKAPPAIGPVVAVMPVYRAPFAAVSDPGCIQPVGLSSDRRIELPHTQPADVEPAKPHPAEPAVSDSEKTQAIALDATLRNADLGALQRKPEPEPADTQPASEADTQRLPAADSGRTGETAVAEGAHA